MENTVTLQIVSADIPGMLQDMLLHDIVATDLCTVDDLTVQLRIRAKDYAYLEKIVQKRGDHIKVLKNKSMSQIGKAVRKRPVMIVGMLLLLLISLYLPTRVLFVRVEGNSTVSSRLILQKAEECGIGFCGSRKNVRSEQVKNSLLNAIPQLQWAGVNTYGCVAVISVQEKSGTEKNEMTGCVSSIVSTADGIITECTVRKGTALCHVGQAVRAGQMLVSGYTDCGLKVQAQAADAEITANTVRNLDMITPDSCMKRGQAIGCDRKISLQIGKKLINFYNGSGISDSTCVKMYSKKYLTLPGGLQLPVALVTVEYTYFTTGESGIASEEGSDLLNESARNYLRTQMIAGQIMQQDTVVLHQEDHYRLAGTFVCTEMIGRTIYEESLYTDGQDH